MGVTYSTLDFTITYHTFMILTIILVIVRDSTVLLGGILNSCVHLVTYSKCQIMFNIRLYCNFVIPDLEKSIKMVVKSEKENFALLYW